uniref:Uncharacterized protein n=1 Tax=Gossypium raimondii TaxID=29730 RepID=A0A0D2TS23_GOSRA|nr:hypothetical protein B456_012G157400 [Gossypium raimondii]
MGICKINSSKKFLFSLLKDFPAVVKSLLQTIINNDDFFYYFYIQISTLIGISEKERFFQPYQIWGIHTMLGNPRLSALSEDEECLTKIIDKYQNNSSYYQIQAGIDLMAKAKYLLQQKDYQFRTDGRRILAYHSYLIKEKDDEGIRLLKKIADMDIEDFPSNIMQQIRSTWENCHQDISTIHDYG